MRGHRIRSNSSSSASQDGEGDNPQRIVANWDALSRRSAYWPLAGDAAADWWDPCDPQLRFTARTLLQKALLLVELFTESVMRSIIKFKVGNRDELLEVLR